MPNFTIEFVAMGSRIQAWLSAPDAETAQILGRLPAWFENWEAIFSRFRPESELSQVNRQSGQWVNVSNEFFEVASLALQAALQTNGLFNPLILDALEAAGYDHTFGDTPTTFVPGRSSLKIGQGTAAVYVPAYLEIDLDARRQSLRLPKHARLDLGGIVKGWAAQCTAYRLAAVGPCLVDAGGDMMALGSPDDSGGWLVGVPDPLTDEDLYRARLTNAAIATSGTDYRRWTRAGEALHHLIDPRTGRPSDSRVLTATIIAPDAVQAETWAKAGLLSGNIPPYPSLFIYHDGSKQMNREFEALCITDNLSFNVDVQ